MILIAASFSLLVIVAGMFLLAKTQKDNLSNFFRYVAWFVIIVGFLNFFGGSAIMVVHAGMQHMKEHYMMMHKKGKHGKHHSFKMYKHMPCANGMGDEECSMMGDEKCEMGGQKCMEMEGKEECMSGGMKKDCCKEKVIVKKDSVVKMK